MGQESKTVARSSLDLGTSKRQRASVRQEVKQSILLMLTLFLHSEKCHSIKYHLSYIAGHMEELQRRIAGFW